MTMNREELDQTIEGIALKIMMVDIKDLPGMAALFKELSSVGDSLEEDPALAEHAESARTASTLIQGIIFEESDDADKDYEAASEAVANLQNAMRNAGRTTEPAKQTEQDDSAVEQAAPIDNELFEAFLEQQRSVLPEIDEAILAFEQEGSTEHLATLRRVLHTMKGEAGCCGFADVEKLCHKVEDYLETDGSKTEPVASADSLFQVKDWLASAIDSYSNGSQPEGLDALLEMLSQPPVPQEAPAEDSSEQKPDEASVCVTADSATETLAPATSPDVGAPISDPDLAQDFVGEAQEHLDSADENLLTLEDNPTDDDAVNAVFRSFHTIKGVSGFIGLTAIGDLAHKAENLLDDVRKGKRSFEASVVDATFKALDMLKIMNGDLADALNKGTNFTTRPELAGLMDQLALVLAGEEPTPAPASPAPPAEEQPDPSSKDTEEKSVPVEAPASTVPAQTEDRSPAATNSPRAAIKQTMKVDAEKIDLLLDTIGELVITESMVVGCNEIQSLQSQQLEKNLSQLSKITGQLQDMAMSMRLIPVAGLFKKMARLVRDLAHKSGKKVEFSMEGEDTEIDKGMVDKLGDPLVHMIRNSVDHGIEDNPQERIAAGKSEVGHVTLKAFHQGGSIHIQIIDDGKGLDRDAIVAKAIAKGVITSDKDMSDQDIFSLIFEAGFSTAKKITEVSGRGVGMDVVRRNIESLRGKVRIDSRPGRGSTFTIVLPLTTAIIDGMLTKVGDETYIIPTLSIIQSFRPKNGEVSSVIGKGRMVSFRGGLLPLFDLSNLFDLGTPPRDVHDSIIVVVEESGKQAAMIADALLGQQQIVIKSIGESLGHLAGVSGACIMSDGKPGLIIDIAGLIRLAEVNADDIHSDMDMDVPEQDQVEELVAQTD